MTYTKLRIQRVKNTFWPRNSSLYASLSQSTCVPTQTPSSCKERRVLRDKCGMRRGRNRVYHRKYWEWNIQISYTRAIPKIAAYLRRADFVEDDKRECLHEPSKGEVALPLAKQHPRTKRQHHLRHEAGQRRPNHLSPQRKLDGLEAFLSRWVCEVDEVEVGREVVTVV